MIGSDIPGDSHIRDQNTNGPQIQRWQPVVGVHNLAVLRTNLMNQIPIIHRSLSPSLMACLLSPQAERNEGRAEGRRIFVLERVYGRIDGRTHTVFFLLILGRSMRHLELIYSSLWCKPFRPETHQKVKKKKKWLALKARLPQYITSNLKLLELVEHPLCFDKPGQCADVCNWKVCIP